MRVAFATAPSRWRLPPRVAVILSWMRGLDAPAIWVETTPGL